MVLKPREGESIMNPEKFEHKSELDCEVTVFEGAHSTCDQTEEEPQPQYAAEKNESNRQKPTKDNYNI